MHEHDDVISCGCFRQFRSSGVYTILLSISSNGSLANQDEAIHILKFRLLRPPATGE